MKNGTKFKVYDMHVFDIYDVDYKSKDITTLLVSLITRNNIKETYSGTIKNNKLEVLEGKISTLKLQRKLRQFWKLSFSLHRGRLYT